jgi:hypothetical protein
VDATDDMEEQNAELVEVAGMARHGMALGPVVHLE